MSENRTLWATLIGINAYPTTPLGGCVKDVLDIDQVLREQCAQQTRALRYEPFYLLAPDETDLLRLEGYNEKQGTDLIYGLPTFDNVSKKAFNHLKQAKNGDICVFYFSGHGSQVDAPEEFWHNKPDKQNETIVCVDSRDPLNPASRDILDKELAYLIWDALQDKDVHALLLMDCCHSGNNTRQMVTGIDGCRYRFIPSSRNKIKLTEYIGFQSPGFYKISDGKAQIQIARYVHLAAAQDSEKAQETNDGGLFTAKLVTALRSGGTAKSYRDLMQSIGLTVRNRNPQQNPVAYAREDMDLDQLFLGAGMEPYRPSFEIRYNFARSNWEINGGTQHGLTPGKAGVFTAVRVIGGEVEALVNLVEVGPDSAVLDKNAMSNFDLEREDLKAVIVRLAAPALLVGISPDLAGRNTQLELIKAAFRSGVYPYVDIDFENAGAREFLIENTDGHEWMLVRASSAAPLFKRQLNAVTFLDHVNAVGKWTATLELKNADTRIKKSDFIFNLERIEGEYGSNASPDSLTGEPLLVQPGDEVIFNYKNARQPAFRLNITIAPDSALTSCYVGALYLGSKYGINTKLIRSDNSRLLKNANPLQLSYVVADRISTTIPLTRDKRFDQYNINEVTDYLKIVVSSNILDLDRYAQESLQLDTQFVDRHREIGEEEALETAQTDWTVFDFKFRIVGSSKEQTLEPGITTYFPAFSIDVPEGFSAKAFAVTGEDIQRKLKKAGMRGINAEADAIISSMVLPEIVWGENVTENAFSSGLGLPTDSQVQVLELRSLNGEPLELPAGKSIIIKPSKTQHLTRSVDEALEEVIIPIGFDETSQLFFPLGSSDADGNIHIDFLPSETDGLIQGDGPLERSLGGSFKMFFRKLFRKKSGINNLTLYGFRADGTWERLEDNPSKMERIIKAKAGSRVLLLIHGLTGDTRHMVSALEALQELSEEASFVLTYDYENLSTPIDKAAQELHKLLSSAGFGKIEMPKITIIAHSQGGLLARWLVEKEQGNIYINHLILVAAASSGSELAKLVSSVFGMLTHAINVTGPIKFAISGLSFLLKALKADPGRTLKDTKPDSEFIGRLKTSRQPTGVRYNVVAGDTALIGSAYDGDDPFLKKVKEALVKKVFFPGLTFTLYDGQPNDFAVTIESMNAIDGYDATTHTRTIASTHLAYFREKRAQSQLLDFLREPV